jgi:hypothetical protein
MELTHEFLAGICGIVLSLGFAYIPGLNVWYAGLTSQHKSLLMLGLLFGVAAILFLMACGGILAELTGITITCDRSGLILMVRILIAAVVANQAAYQISPEARAVREAKAAR